MSSISNVSTGTILVPTSGATPATTNYAAEAQAIAPTFDANQYLAVNTDVKDYAINNGLDPVAFAAQHYVNDGHREGRTLRSPTLAADSSAIVSSGQSSAMTLNGGYGPTNNSPNQVTPTTPTQARVQDLAADFGTQMSTLLGTNNDGLLSKLSNQSTVSEVNVVIGHLNAAIGDFSAIRNDCGMSTAQQAALDAKMGPTIAQLTSKRDALTTAVQNATQPAYYSTTPSGSLESLLGPNTTMLNLPENLLPPGVKEEPGYGGLSAYTDYLSQWKPQPYVDSRNFRPRLDAEAPFSLEQFVVRNNYVPPKPDPNADSLAANRAYDRNLKAYEEAMARPKCDLGEVNALKASLGEYGSQFKVYDSNPRLDPVGLVKKVVPPSGDPVYVVEKGEHRGNATIALKGWENGYAGLSTSTETERAAYSKARQTAGQEAFDSFKRQYSHGEIVGPATAEQARDEELARWPNDPSGEVPNWNLSKRSFSNVGTQGNAENGSLRSNILLTSDPLKTVDKTGRNGIYDIVPDPVENDWFGKLAMTVVMGVCTAGIGSVVAGAIQGTTLAASAASAVGCSVSTIATVGSAVVVGGVRAELMGGDFLQGALMGGLTAGVGVGAQSLTNTLTSSLGDMGLTSGLSNLTGMSMNNASNLVSSGMTGMVSGGATAVLSGQSIGTGALNGLVSGTVSTGTNILGQSLQQNLLGDGQFLSGANQFVSSLTTGFAPADQAIVNALSAATYAALTGHDAGQAAVNAAAGTASSLVANMVPSTSNAAADKVIGNIAGASTYAFLTGHDAGQAAVRSVTQQQTTIGKIAVQAVVTST